MSGIKQTPRQKMIGMMYLVLTALLALNVSKEILDAFVSINTGLLRSNNVLEKRSFDTFNLIRNSTEKEKRVPFELKATEFVKESDQLMSYIETLKARAIAASVNGNKTGEGFEEFLSADGRCIALDAVDQDGDPRIRKLDEDQNITSLLVGPRPESPRNDAWSASELKTKLETYRDYCTNIRVVDILGKAHTPDNRLTSAIDSVFTFGKEMELDKMVDWEVKHFYHVPVAAAITYLTKLQSDVASVKADVLEFLSKGIVKDHLNFSGVSVAVVPKQNYVLRGDSFEAEVYLTALDVSNKTRLFVGSEVQPGSAPQVFDESGSLTSVESDADGKARFRISTNALSLGEHGFSGMLEYMKNGKPEKIPFTFPSFTVAEPAATVSPTKMNVFYRGLENPVDVSVPGADKSTIQITCPGHQVVRQSNGEWIIKPGSANEARVSVTAEINGERKQMGETLFRVKKIPTPVPYIGNKSCFDKSVSKNDLHAVLTVYPKMEGFDFDVNVQIISYKLSYWRNGNPVERICRQRTLSTDDRDWINNTKVGDIFYVEDFSVRLPDDRVVELPMIKLKVTN